MLKDIDINIVYDIEKLTCVSWQGDEIDTAT